MTILLVDAHLGFSLKYAELANTLVIHLGTAEALAQQVTQEHFEKGLIYPPFSNIRKISAHIAAKVAAKAYELG